MSRKRAWTDEAWADYLYWQGQDKKTLKRINKLIEETMLMPFEGIGKPEPLRPLAFVVADFSLTTSAAITLPETT
jgi:Txe/YoeB family toxin of Txe-Axe toxin-antitoxin module